MKKILFLSIILISNFISKAQNNNSGDSTTVKPANGYSTNSFLDDDNTPQVKNSAYYMTKSRNQKIGAWILVGAGALGLGIGIASFPDSYDPIFDTNSKSTDNQASTATTLMIIGGVAALASIPLFVCSASNKHKARLLMSKEKAAAGLPFKTDITGLTLSIPLGR